MIDCIHCINGLRVDNNPCKNCGRTEETVTFNHTGRYWNPLIVDLKAASRNVPLYYDKKKHIPVYADYDRSKPPTIDLPVLFSFPGPYHPFEVVIAYRGFGSTFGSQDPTWGVNEIMHVRADRSRFVKAVAKYLYWPESTAWVFFHLLTPLVVNHIPKDPTLGLRGLLYSQIGVGAINASDAVHSANNGQPMVHFYNTLVKGTVEL